MDEASMKSNSVAPRILSIQEYLKRKDSEGNGRKSLNKPDLLLK